MRISTVSRVDGQPLTVRIAMISESRITKSFLRQLPKWKRISLSISFPSIRILSRTWSDLDMYEGKLNFIDVNHHSWTQFIFHRELEPRLWTKIKDVMILISENNVLWCPFIIQRMVCSHHAMKTHLEFMSSTSRFKIEHDDYLLVIRTKLEIEVGNIDKLEISISNWEVFSWQTRTWFGKWKLQRKR